MDSEYIENINESVLKMRAATLLSQSIQYTTNRGYLDGQNNLSDIFHALYSSEQYKPCFIQIKQLTDINDSSLTNTLLNLQTALLACHSVNHVQLLFVIINDGLTNKIYFGARSKEKTPKQFMKSFQHFFEGIYPGSETKFITPEMKEFNTDILEQIQDLDCAICVTGIPSLKKSIQNEYICCADKLISGMSGEPFAYLVIADPIPSEELNEAINRCRDLESQIHSYGRINFSKSISENSSIQKSLQNSTSKTIGNSYSKKDDSNLLLEAGYYGMADLLQAYFSPLGFSLMFMGDSIFDDSTNISYNNSFTESLSQSFSESIGSSFSEQLGNEYINAHVQASETILHEYSDRLYKKRAMGLWNVGVYFLSTESVVSNMAGMQLVALLNGENSTLEPVRWHNLDDLTSQYQGIKHSLWKLEHPKIYLKPNYQGKHPLGSLYTSLSTPLTTEELSLYVHCPQKEIPGLKYTSTTSFSLNQTENIKGLELGSFIDNGKTTSIPYKVDSNSFCKHVLVTGINGSGKSTTCRRILNEMLKNNKPFLVVEPAKDEYVQWAMEYNNTLPPNSHNKIHIYIPGCTKWHNTLLNDKLKLNPFDIIWLTPSQEPRILTHIDHLKATFNSSLPMHDVLPVLMEEFLYYIYEHSAGKWLENPKFDAFPPTLSGALFNLDDFMKSVGYEEKINKNISAALKNRLISLTRGWKGELFNPSSSSKSSSWNDLFDSPTVINLSYLGDDDDKSFAMSIILQFLYEYRQAQVEIGKIAANSGNLNHLTIIEEAHRIMSKPQVSFSGDSNAKSKASSLFSHMLSEVRAYGEGFLIAEQVPERLISDAIKNTNIKIVHRLVAADDRKSMAECMNLNQEQTNIISKLKPGQAIISTDLSDSASWININSNTI